MSETKGAITVDVPDFSRQIRRLTKDHGITVKAVMVDQHRLWTTDLLKATPPKNRAQGKVAIEKSLKRVFVRIDDREALNFIVEGFRDLGHIVDADSDAKRFVAHQALRDRRGRVRKDRPRMVFVRGMMLPLKMYVATSDFNRYVKRVQRRIGLTKAGWIPAAQRFRSKIPAWVNKAQGRRSGSGIHAMNDSGDGFLESINNVPWVGRFESGIRNATLNKRKRDLSIHLDRAVERVANRENARA